MTHPGRDAVRDCLDDYDALVRHAATQHIPEFLTLDVTMPQAKVLHLLGATGRTRMSALARQLGVSLPTMTGLADRLVEHGLVERLVDSADRRHVLVDLTARGRDVLASFHEVGRAHLRRLLEYLRPDDIEHLRRGLHALVAAAEQGSAQASIVPSTDSAPHHERKPA